MQHTLTFHTITLAKKFQKSAGLKQKIAKKGGEKHAELSCSKRWLAII